MILSLLCTWTASGDGGRHSSAGDRDRPYRTSNHGNRGSFSGSKNTDRSGGLYSGQPTSSAASHGQPQGDYKFSNAGGSSGHPHHNYGSMDDGPYKDRRNHSVYPAHSGSYAGHKRERRDSDNNSRQMTGHYSSRSTEKRGAENERRGKHAFPIILSMFNVVYSAGIEIVFWAKDSKVNPYWIRLLGE